MQTAESVELGQHDVQHEQVVRRRGGHGQAIFAIVRDVDGIAMLFQPALEDAGQFVFVFDNQDAHGLRAPYEHICGTNMKFR